MEKQYAIDVVVQQISSDSPVLEVGVFGGRSTSFMGALLAMYDKTKALVTVIPWWECPSRLVLKGPKDKSA